MSYALYRQPSRFRIIPLPNGWSGDTDRADIPRQEKPERDQFGLATAIYGNAPQLSRQYVARWLDFLKLPKTVSPTVLFGVSAGTIPELCIAGFLTSEGYRYRESGPRSFVWLSYETAGNVEIQTQLDFSVWQPGNRRIGVDSDSVYHTAKNPFAPGQKLEQDRRRRQRLLTQTGLANVISVNEGRWGHPLENGPDSLVRQDLQRILAA